MKEFVALIENKENILDTNDIIRDLRKKRVKMIEEEILGHFEKQKAKNAWPERFPNKEYIPK